MATPGKAVKKVQKKHIPAKTSFTSPLPSKWSSLPQEDMLFILKTLKDKLISIGLEKKEEKVFRLWRKKKEGKLAPASEPVPLTVRHPTRNGWTDVEARRQLAIGINEVTKALERNELQLLLVCKSARPNHMTNHLIALSVTRGVPACQVPRLSQSVSEPLGLKSVLALGFRQCSSKEELFSDTIDAIKPRVPSLDVVWLQAEAPRVTPEQSADMGEEEQAGGMRGQKRKLESESEVVTDSPFSMLQPLKVKRIVPNPARKRVKSKKKPAK
ncbi:ribonuclease P protein subunit p38 [Xenentodon cancila]